MNFRDAALQLADSILTFELRCRLRHKRSGEPLRDVVLDELDKLEAVYHQYQQAFKTSRLDLEGKGDRLGMFTFDGVSVVSAVDNLGRLLVPFMEHWLWFEDDDHDHGNKKGPHQQCDQGKR